MRRILTIISAVIVALIATLLVFHSDLSESILPPAAKLAVNNSEVESFESIDGTVLKLDVSVPHADRNLSAGLYLNGAMVDEIRFTRAKVSFRSFVLPAASSHVTIEMRRRIGPFSTSRRQSLRIFANQNRKQPLELLTPSAVWSDSVVIKGTATPGSQVSIYIGDKKAPIIDNDRSADKAHVDHLGRFAVQIQLPGPGTHRIKAVAELNRHDVVVRSSKEAEIEFRSALPPLVKRKLTAIVSDNGFRMDLQATLEADDPRIVALIEGASTLQAFVRVIHGSIRINNSYYPSVKYGDLRLRSQAGRTWVAIRTDRISSSPIRNGRTTIARIDGAQVIAKADIIEIQTDGPQLTGFTPEPVSAIDNVVQWTGITDRTGVTALLASSTHAASLWRLTPTDVLPSVATGTFYALLSAIPIVWLMFIIRGGFGAELGQAHQQLLRKDTYLLGVLIFFSPSYFALNQLSHSLGESARQFIQLELRSISHLFEEFRLVLIAEITAVYVAAVVIWVFARILITIAIRARTAAAMLRDLLSIMIAATTCAYIFQLVEQIFRAMPRLHYAGVSGFAMIIRLATAAICVAIGLALVRRLYRTATDISGRTPTIQPILSLGALVVLLFIAFPPEAEFDSLLNGYGPQITDILSGAFSFLNRLGYLAPVATALLACVALIHVGRRPGDAAYKAVRLMLFAGILVGATPAWIIFPVPLLLAIALLSPVVLMPAFRAQLFARNKNDIFANRELLLQRTGDHARRFAHSAGLFGFGLFGVKQGEKPSGSKFTPLTVTMPDGSRMRAPELAFAFGTHGNAAANGLAAVRTGVWGAAIFVLIYALPTFVQTADYDRFPYVWALSRVISVGGYWLIGAFFLGYFYESIRGRAGWEKGAWVALGISLANEPMSLLVATSAADYAAIGITVGQRFAFFIFVGLIAFDLHLFRKALGKDAEWRLFSMVSGLSVVGASASVLIAAAGVAISSALTGQFTSVLGQVAGALLPTIADTPGIAR